MSNSSTDATISPNEAPLYPYLNFSIESNFLYSNTEPYFKKPEDTASNPIIKYPTINYTFTFNPKYKIKLYELNASHEVYANTVFLSLFLSKKAGTPVIVISKKLNFDNTHMMTYEPYYLSSLLSTKTDIAYKFSISELQKLTTTKEFFNSTFIYLGISNNINPLTPYANPTYYQDTHAPYDFLSHELYEKLAQVYNISGIAKVNFIKSKILNHLGKNYPVVSFKTITNRGDYLDRTCLLIPKVELEDFLERYFNLRKREITEEEIKSLLQEHSITYHKFYRDNDGNTRGFSYIVTYYEAYWDLLNGIGPVQPRTVFRFPDGMEQENMIFEKKLATKQYYEFNIASEIWSFSELLERIGNMIAELEKDENKK